MYCIYGYVYKSPQEDEIKEPSLLSGNLRSAVVCKAHIGLIHVHIQPRRATFGMEK